MNPIKTLSIAATGLFMLITLYDLLFHGWFEPSTIEVDWWVAGAGTTTLTIRFILLAVSVVLASIMIFQKQSIIQRVAWVSIALIIPPIFVYSASGIERYSASYREDLYQQIIQESEAGKVHTKDSVQSLLGTPLSKDRNDSIWSYTYMPSCGWGWTKRTVKFDNQDRVIGWDKYREP